MPSQNAKATTFYKQISIFSLKKKSQQLKQKQREEMNENNKKDASLINILRENSL